MDSVQNPVRWSYWLWLLLSLLALKFLLFYLDSDVGFFLGDSATYLYTALEHWIPRDRSWTFGFFVDIAMGPERSLERLVVIQILISVVTCALLALVLINFLRCSPGIAAAAALLCAVEPVQLLFERYVMAETLSLLVFALFLISTLFYLRRGQLPWLCVAAFLAVLAASLRTAYLPVVSGVSALAILYYALFSVGQDPDDSQAASQWWRKLVTLVAHAGVFVVLFSHGVALERAVVKEENHTPYFLLASWSPLLADDYFSKDPELQWLFKDLPCALGNPFDRAGQMWVDDCLMDRIEKHVHGSRKEKVEFVTDLVHKIALHNPLGVLERAWSIWLEPWNDARFSTLLRIDRGREPPTPDTFVKLMHDYFDWDVRYWHLRTSLTKDWYDYNIWWYRILSLTPLLLILWWLATRRSLNPYSLIIAAASSSLLALIMVTAATTSMRFFHAIAWLSIIGLASIVDRAVRYLRQ